MKDGPGRYEGANGVYEGHYRNGKKHGLGTFSWIDGRCIVPPCYRLHSRL